MGIDIVPATLPPIIQVCLVYNWVFIVVVMKDVDIGLIPANFLHIIMVGYILSTKGLLDELFQEV